MALVNETNILTLAPAEDRKLTIIFIHGLGQTVQYWIPTIQTMAKDIPYAEWILPQAPVKSVTLHNNRLSPSWFNITALPPRDNEYDERNITESIAFVESIIISKVQSGIEPKSIVIVGFSQGAALSMMTALTTLHDLGGVASFSGWIPRRIRDQMIHTEPNLPIFWAHGTADEEIPVAYAAEAIGFLKGCLHITDGCIMFEKYDDLGHETNERVLKDFVRWLSNLSNQTS